MSFTLPGWAKEPVMWIAGIVIALQGVLDVLTGHSIDIETLYEALIILFGAFAARSQVAPVSGVTGYGRLPHQPVVD